MKSIEGEIAHYSWKLKFSGESDAQSATSSHRVATQFVAATVLGPTSADVYRLLKQNVARVGAGGRAEIDSSGKMPGNTHASSVPVVACITLILPLQLRPSK